MVTQGSTIYAATRSAKVDQRGKDALLCRIPFDSTWTTLDKNNFKVIRMAGGGTYKDDH